MMFFKANKNYKKFREMRIQYLREAYDSLEKATDIIAQEGIVNFELLNSIAKAKAIIKDLKLNDKS